MKLMKSIVFTGILLIYSPVLFCSASMISDEQKTDAMENFIKASFAKVFSNMISAVQNPAEAPKYIASMVQTFLDVVYEALKNKDLSKEELYEYVIKCSQNLEQKEYARAIIMQVKKALRSSPEYNG